MKPLEDPHLIRICNFQVSCFHGCFDQSTFYTCRYTVSQPFIFNLLLLACFQRYNLHTYIFCTMKSGKSKKTVTNKQSNCCPQHKTTLKTKTMCYQATWPNQYQFVHSATSRPQQTKLGKIEKNSLFSLPSLSPSSFANWTHIPFDHSTILWI